ncbi:ATP-binding protein [Spongiivirga sp. MCCC 1A20706]|uniref:ATP-binding response regulator n=1 Tax=Spongiivirga sp. MCCC 1A20706 TaxID=3160963 RepID=UPI003977CE8B
MAALKRHLLFFLSFLVIGITGLFSQHQTPLANKELDSIQTTMISYFYKGDYYKILEDYDKALAIVRNYQEPELERKLITLVGGSFLHIQDTLGAERIFKKEMDKALKSKNDTLISFAHFNLGNVYYGASHNKAIYHYNEGKKIVTRLKDTIRLFVANYNIAESYYSIKKYDSAQIFLSTAKPFAQKITDRPGFIASTHYLQGAIYQKKGKHKKALEELNVVVAKGKGQLYPEMLIDTYRNLIEAHNDLKEYELANEARKSYDSLIEIKYREDKIALEKTAISKYKLKEIKKELKAQELKKELAEQKAYASSKFSWLMGLIAFISLVSTALIFRSRITRNKALKELKLKNQQYLEAKEKSEKLAVAKTQFFSTISHELRTPLYAITGLTEVLLKKEKNRSDELQSLKFSADYLLSLVNDVLQINKLDSTKGKQLITEPFSLTSLISDITDSLEFMNSKNQNTISINIEEGLTDRFEGDKMKLSQILINLIGNACKFTNEGMINVKIDALSESNDTAHLRFIIQDTGIGISKEDQAKIFEEFTQFTNSNDYQGTGLGLSIVQKLLKLFESKLVIDSTPGKGSIFSFEIKLRKENNNNTSIPLAKKQDVSVLNGLNILIVDDNKINQIVTQKIIGQYDMTFQSAFDGEKAVEAVKVNTFDIILMDLNMPVMNGFDASKKIREHKIQTPIIALTAVEKGDLDVDLTEYGINDIVVKPYQTDEFLRKLMEYI